MWGDRDGVIPVAHAHRAHEAMPGSRLEVFAGAGHFPHHADPDRFVGLLRAFVATHRAGAPRPDRFRDLLRRGPDPAPRPPPWRPARARMTRSSAVAS